MTFPTHPTYEQIHAGCQTFARIMENNPPDAIIGVVRGGLINAVIISHLLGNIPVIPVDYSSSKGKGDNVGSHSDFLPEIYKERVCLIEDIVDSGYTMEELVERYENRGHIVYSYASYVKSSSVFTPSSWTWMIPEDAPWIIFPWETTS